MVKRTVTLTLEMPIEVAEWIAVHAESIGLKAHYAASKARFASEQQAKDREERFQQRKTEFERLGRSGFRELRKRGVRKSLQKKRHTIKEVPSGRTPDARPRNPGVCGWDGGLARDRDGA